MGGAEWISDCGKARLIHGDCLERLRELPDCSVDSVVTDPPAGIGFMGKDWDKDKGGRDNWIKWMAEIAAECLRVLKPGGHALVWSIPRTSHWTATAWEDAGFQPRDRIAHCFGSGFPKSMNISKQLDKMAGAEREKKRVKPRPDTCGTMAGSSDTRPWIERSREVGYHEVAGDTPITESALQWNGWGTALKPAIEDWWLLRKPLIGTVAENVLAHGTGGINVDGCRVAHGDDVNMAAVQRQKAEGSGIAVGKGFVGSILGKEIPMYKPLGRWPANVIHDGSDEVVGLMGDAARFFYVPKASKADRDEGCEGLEYRTAGEMVDREEGSAGIDNPRAGAGRTGGARNFHPTVKPTALMRYLCRLVTPPGGIVLDPFTGSGSTGKAAILEGFRFIGIEREAEYLEIAKARIAHAISNYQQPEDKPAQLTLLPDQP